MSLPNRSTAQSFNATSKVNDMLNPPANETIQWDNPSLARGVCDVAGLGLVSPRFTCRFQTATSTGGIVLLTNWAVWSNVTDTLPIFSRTGTGVFTITVPPTVSDEYDASFNTINNIAVNFIGAQITLEGTTFGFANASAVGNIVTVNLANTSGTPSDLTGITCFVVGF